MQVNSLNKFGKNSSNKIASKNDQVNSIAVSEHEKSKLDLSYTHTTTFNVGDVVPVMQLEAYPGDSFDFDINCLIRMSMPSAPVMDAPRFDFNLFFIPYEQVWEHFSYLIGESYNGGSPVVVDSVPVINFDTTGQIYGVNDLATHMEIPANVDMSTTGMSISALPFRAYVKVWNEWFRDENLDSAADFSNQDNPGVDIFASHYWGSDVQLSAQVGRGLLKSNRLKDYFSSCLPFVQKGDPIDLPVLDAAALNEIFNNAKVTNWSVVNGNPANEGTFISPTWYQGGSVIGTNAGLTAGAGGSTYADYQGSSYVDAQLDLDLIVSPGSTLQYEGNAQGSFNVPQLRAALVKQHQMELDARAGTRYYEKLLSYWGVSVDPLSIGRTLYIGGFHDSININNVVQSAPATTATSNSPLGSLGALSITATKNPTKFHCSISQYGIILGLVTVRTNISYSQGLPRLFTTCKNFDFYNPSFNGISEQPIYKYELYLDSNVNNNMSVFGYNQPFAHLKYKPNVCSGYLSANVTDSYYQLYSYQNKLASSPTLSNTWMYYPKSALENTLLLDSSNNTELVNDFMSEFYFNIICTREIPAYSIPGVDKV